MKVKLFSPINIDGTVHEAGDTVTVDKDLAIRMLNGGTAVAVSTKKSENSETRESKAPAESRAKEIEPEETAKSEDPDQEASSTEPPKEAPKTAATKGGSKK